MTMQSQSWELSFWEYRLLCIGRLPVGEMHRRLQRLSGEGWRVERVVCDSDARAPAESRAQILLRRRRRAS